MTLRDKINEKTAELSSITNNMRKNGKSEEEIRKFGINEMKRFAEELYADKSIDIEKEITEGIEEYKPSGNMLIDFFLYMISGNNGTKI